MRCRPHFFPGVTEVNRRPTKTHGKTERGLLVPADLTDRFFFYVRTCPCEHEDGEEGLPQRHCTAAVAFVVVAPEDKDGDVEEKEAAVVAVSDHSNHYNHSSILPFLLLGRLPRRRRRRRRRLLHHSRLL